MPTSVSPLSAEQMIKANSGAYYLLHEGGGYTGNLNLTGPARIDNLNAGNAYVQGVLNVTGNQAVFGNLTGFNFNHFARIVNTGDAYLRSVTGVATFNEINVTGRTKIDQIYDGLNISGDLGLVGDARMTGAVNITGTLFVNGQQITGVSQASQELVLTGNYTSLYANRGDILVGTGNSGIAILQTGGAHGYVQIVDTGSVYGHSYVNAATLVNSLVYLSENSGNFSTSKAITLKPVDPNNGICLNFDVVGSGSYIFGSTGFNTSSASRSSFVFGSGNVLSSARFGIAMGQGNTVVGLNSLAIGKSCSTNDNDCFAIGTENQSLGGFALGKRAISYGPSHFAIGGGNFGGSAYGNSQSNIVTAMAETNDSTEAFTNFPSIAGGTGVNGMVAFSYYVAATDSEGTVGAGYELRGCAKKSAGSFSPVGSVTKTVFGEEAAGWDVNATFGGTLGLEATSDGGIDVKWSATCIINQVMI